MPVWPALVLAPLLALAHVALGHAMATPSCAAQDDHSIPLLSLGLLAATLALTWMAAVEARRRRARAAREPLEGAASRPPFIARVATWNGALSALVIAAQAIAPWMLSACIA